MICRNLRSGPISAVLIFSLTAILLKLDLIQTLVNKFVLTAARFWLQRWLAIRTISHKIWLAVGINGSWKHLFLAWLFSWMISRRRREGSIFPSFFIVLWSYSRKICLNMSMEIQKIQMVVLWLYRRVESLFKLLTTKKVPFDLPTNECKSKYCPS